jgi:O-antigen ligase
MRSPVRYLPYPLEWAWLLLGLATVTIEQRPGTQALVEAIDSTIFLRFSIVCAALVIVVLHLRRVPRFRLSPISLFLIYVMFGVASSLWSASFIGSFGKSIELMAATLVVWITMARVDRESRLQRLIYWAAAEIGLSLAYATIGAIFDPGDFSEPSRGILPYALTSPRTSSNSISQFGAFLGLFCLAKAFEGHGRWYYRLCYLTCLAFPVAAQGRTGMVSAVVGSALLLARRYPMGSVIAIPAIAGLASVLLGDPLWKLFLRGQDEELLYSMSGRTTMWEAGWQAFLTKPFFGAGFGVGSKGVLFSLFTHDFAQASSLHNGPLEVVLGVGLVGFSLWACAVSFAVSSVVVAYVRGDHLPILIGMVVAISSTFLSIGVGGWLDLVLLYFLAASAFFWVRSRQRGETARTHAARLSNREAAAE